MAVDQTSIISGTWMDPTPAPTSDSWGQEGVDWTWDAGGAGSSFDFTQFMAQFPKFAGGISTIISAASGKPYQQTAQGGASGGGLYPAGTGLNLGLTQGGLFGGISTTTLLLGLGIVLLFMSSPRRR